MMDVVKLYPQYHVITDRRQQKAPVSPVAFERRSGIDRRSDDRIKLDTSLTRDIFEIKNKVAQLQKPENKPEYKNIQGPAFTQNSAKVAQNILKADEFVKTTKPNTVENTKELAKAESNHGALLGVFSAVLGGTLASTMLGIAGVGIAIGIGAFFGGKFLKSAIVSHLTNKK